MKLKTQLIWNGVHFLNLFKMEIDKNKIPEYLRKSDLFKSLEDDDAIKNT